jgi:Ino eighty subunit 1
MAASLSPVGGMSDPDQPSSPVRHGNGYGHEHSFVNHTEDEDTRMDDHPLRVDHTKPHRSRMSSGPKRSGSEPNKDGSNIGKVKHLKKEDGEPLWRKDIQHDFLKAVFDNELKVFTNSYEPNLPKQCFADLYIDTMSRSSKTSKVLRDKLLSDREAAKGMAMVCLLVNIGRMNTTLNCEYNARRVSCSMGRSNILIHNRPYSLPRDASSTSDLPRHTVLASLSRPPSI